MDIGACLTSYGYYVRDDSLTRNRFRIPRAGDTKMPCVSSNHRVKPVSRTSHTTLLAESGGLCAYADIHRPARHPLERYWLKGATGRDCEGITNLVRCLLEMVCSI